MSAKHRTPDVPILRHLDTHRVDGEDASGVVLIDPAGVAEGSVFVPDAILPVVARFDGAHTVDAIEREIRAELGGTPLPDDLVPGLVRQFDEALLLHSDRFRAALDAAVAEFAAREARAAAHAGSAGYPEPEGACREALSGIVRRPSAPDRAPRPLHGLVAPHIDLLRGREGYAAAYGRLAEATAADLFVVFGTGHQGPAAAVTGLRADWETPLGRVPTDRAFVDAVHTRLGPPDPLDVFLHRREHSLEFQVLFLQHLLGGRDRPFEVAGFLTGSLPPDAAGRNAVVETFRAVAEAHGKTICWVAGADLAHLGPTFGDSEPIDAALLARLEAEERARLRHLESGAPDAFFDAVEAHGNPDRVCGTVPIFLTAALAGGPGHVLHYGQAGAAGEDQVVSFCSVAFEAGPGAL